MIVVYFLFLISAIISLAFYTKPKMALKIGFGLSALSCLYAGIYFLLNLSKSQNFTLFGNFLYSPKFELTPLGNFFSFVVVFVGFASSIYALNYAKEYLKKANLGVFACLFNIFILSMLLVISANNTFCFIVLWELMTLISVFLILINDEKGKSLNAVMTYLGIAQIGAFCIVCGLLAMSYFAGSFEFSEFKNLEIPLLGSVIIFILFLVGFGSKAGMWPFHVWLPLAHPAAPSNVSALMSGVMIKVALFAFIKFVLFLPLNLYFGIAILILGALSSLFGVLYALCQHDYKALLAYHSVENIGIILLGLGAGFCGLALGNIALATIGFIGGFYHILNHATFKGLLFLSAGSVLSTTHTRDMEVLGGLAKKMPLTAAFFLIGSMAITALPPLNGFISEWLVYKAMFLGGAESGIIARFSFCISIVALALTGVLAVMCFVKVYSVIFSGTPRDMKIYENAKESPKFMLIGMGILALGCIAFGLGANFVIKNIINSVSFVANNFDLNLVSMPLIFLVLMLSLVLPFLILFVMKANLKKPRQTEPWACGFIYDSRMQMTASPFTGNLRRIMNFLFRADKKIIIKDYFSPVVYENKPKDIWWVILYEPFIKYSKLFAQKIGILQNGYSNLYVLYIVIYLCLMLAVSYFLI